MSEADDLPRVIFRTHWAPLTLTRAPAFRHSFGGSLAFQVHGWPGTLPPPHRLLTLDLSDPSLSLESQVTELPLLYAFRLDGCCLQYTVTDDGNATALEVSGSPASDWPYPGYPTEFPFHPLVLGSFGSVHWDCDYDSDECDEGHPWETTQGSEPEEDELLVIVPPSSTYGVSLWGDEGDREGVQTIFRINTESLTVEAWNECS